MSNPNMHTERSIRYSVILAVVLSMPILFLAVFSSDALLEGFDTFKFLPNHLRLAGVILSILSFVLVACISYAVFEKGETVIAKINGIRLHRYLVCDLRAESLLRCMLFLMVCWAPILITMYPGAGTGGDTTNQLYQYFSAAPTYRGLTGEFVDAEFINDSPLLDTLIFGTFVKLGRLVNSDQLGFFAYCLTQSVLTAFTFSLVICYGQKLSVPPVLRVLTLLFVAICPMFPRASFAMIKDSLFSIWLVIYCLLYFEVCRSDGAALESIPFLLLFIIVSSLCALTKLTGVYTILLANAVLLFVFKGSRIRVLLLTVITYAIYAVVIPATVFVALDVHTPQNPGGIPGSQMLYQQVITALRRNPDALSQEDYDALNEIMDVEKAKESLNPSLYDGVTRCVAERPFSDKSISFLGIWFKLGLKCPGEYFKSLIRCCAGAFVPIRVFNQEISVYQPGIELYADKAASVGSEFHLDVKNPEYLTSIAVDISDSLINVYGAVPGLSLFLTYGYYGGWVPIICCIACMFFKRKNIVALAPTVMTSLFLIIIPVLNARYVTPSLYLAIPSVIWAMGRDLPTLDSNFASGDNKTGRHHKA